MAKLLTKMSYTNINNFINAKTIYNDKTIYCEKKHIQNNINMNQLDNISGIDICNLKHYISVLSEPSDIDVTIHLSIRELKSVEIEVPEKCISMRELKSVETEVFEKCISICELKRVEAEVSEKCIPICELKSVEMKKCEHYFQYYCTVYWVNNASDSEYLYANRKKLLYHRKHVKIRETRKQRENCM